MPAMTKLFLVAGVVFLTACGSKADNALSEFESFKTRMCECKDAECAKGVKKDMKEWEKKMKDEGASKKDLTDEQKQKARAIDKEMDACRDKLK